MNPDLLERWTLASESPEWHLGAGMLQHLDGQPWWSLPRHSRLDECREQTHLCGVPVPLGDSFGGWQTACLSRCTCGRWQSTYLGEAEDGDWHKP